MTAPESDKSQATTATRVPVARLIAARARVWLRLCVWGGLALLAASHLWPDDLTRTDRWFVLVSYATFFVRTFQDQGAMVLAAAAVALWLLRARRTAVVALVVGIVVLGQALWSLRPRAGHTGGDPTLTIMSVNLELTLGAGERLMAQINAVRPNVIVFQEYTPRSAGFLGTLLGDYPHRTEHPREDALGQAVYSRLPFQSPPRTFPPGAIWRDPQITVEVEFEGCRVGITDLHLMPPVNRAVFTEQRLQTAALAVLARAAINAPAGGPASAVVYAGDFNAVPASAHMAALRAAGLRSTHAEVGVWRGATWPRESGYLSLFPGVRIDHVLFAGALQCVESGVGDDFGSDHRPVFARFIRAKP